MSDMNLVVLEGRLTRDPMTHHPGETTVASFGLATNYKTRDNEHVSFIECVAFGSTAEFIAQHFLKGRKILIEGALREDRWEDQDGTKRSKLKVVINTVRFMDYKKEE